MISRIAYILQVALVFAACFLVPVQQASQISSVWLTPDPKTSTAVGKLTHLESLKIHQKLPINTHEWRKKANFVKEADFSSTLAGKHFVDPQASSFKPTIAELELNTRNQLKRRDEDDEQDVLNLDEPRKLESQKIGKRSDLRAYTNQTNYANYLQTPLQEARRQNQDNFINDLNPLRNESLNENIHFDEEQHQQLTNWAQTANSRSNGNNQRVNYTSEQPNYKTSDNNQEQFITTTTGKVAASNNYNNHNKSSHHNNYSIQDGSSDLERHSADSDNSAGDEREKEPLRLPQQRVKLPRDSDPNERVFIRFSPADHSSWKVQREARPTMSNQQSLAPVTTTERPEPPPLIYFSANGDKWNQQQTELEQKSESGTENQAELRYEPEPIKQLRHESASLANRFNQEPPFNQLTSSKSYDLDQNQARVDEETTLDELGHLRRRQAQLERLRKQAILLQLRRNQQISRANSRLHNYYGMSNRKHQVNLLRQNHFNFALEPNENRRGWFSSLGQKIALPPISHSSQQHPIEYATLLMPNDHSKAHLERYFYSGSGETETMPIGPLAATGRTRAAYNLAPLRNSLNLASVRQPTIPRAPLSGVYSNPRDRYLASGSYDQVSYLDANPIQASSEPILDQQAFNKHHPAASFIPVVAVTVTKTSPAPIKNDAHSLRDSDENQNSNNNPDLDDYIEKKTRPHHKQQQQKLRYQNDESGSDQSSSQQSTKRQKVPNQQVHSINVPSSSNQNHQHLTTVKSAVFGYLPNQLQDLPPLLHQPTASNEQFYYHPTASSAIPMQSVDTQLPLGLQLQANNLVQNDIAHPFGGPVGTLQEQKHQHSSSGGQQLHQKQQHVSSLGHASSTPYIQYANPMLTAAQTLGAFPLGRASNQAIGQQLLAMAASELNPLAAGYMTPVGRDGPPPFLANPHWFLNEQSKASQDHSSLESAPTSSQVSFKNKNANNNNSNNALSSKGKKRSGEFFASAGQLLLSALPLLLAPTLGLMFASMPPLPTVARHQTLPNFPQQASGGANLLPNGLPGSYLNSLATQQSGNNVKDTAYLFTPSPPLLSAPANPYQSYQQQQQQQTKGARVRPTRFPNRTLSAANGLKNRFLNATGISLDSLLDGTNPPAAIVITTSTTTTSSPQFKRSDANNETSSTTTTRQTIAAIDNLSVLSNQTVVFIPSDEPRLVHNNESAFSLQSSDQDGESIGVASSAVNSSVASPSDDNNQSAATNQHQNTTNHEAKNHSHLQQAELQLKRNHHYEILPSHLYADGADFDTQYATLHNETQAQNKTNANETFALDENQANRLYPVASWPSLRRKTVSLVTSQGNKTFSDASDRYRDGSIASDFILELAAKRANSRIIGQNREKRETRLSIHTKNNLSGQSSSWPIVNNETLNDEPPTLADLEEARQLRAELLERKIHFDRLASTNGQTTLLNSNHEPRQELAAMGSRGHIAPIQLPFASNKKSAKGRVWQNNTKLASQDSLVQSADLLSARESMSDLVGDLMLKNQKEILAQNVLDAEVAQDTNTADDRQESEFEGEIVRSGNLRQESEQNNNNNVYLASLGSNLAQISQDELQLMNNARRSPEFSRQVKYSSHTNNLASRPQHDQKSIQDSSQNHWAQRDSADFVRAGKLSNFARSKLNSHHTMKPILDYDTHRNNQAHKLQQANENGASTMSSYASNDFRPTSANLAMNAADNDHYNNHQQPYNMPTNYNNQNVSNHAIYPYGRSQHQQQQPTSGYSARNYYPPANHNLMNTPSYMTSNYPPNNSYSYNNSNSYNMNGSYGNIAQQYQGAQASNYANNQYANNHQRFPASSSQNEDYVPYNQMGSPDHHNYLAPNNQDRAHYEQQTNNNIYPQQQHHQQPYYQNHQPYNNHQPSGDNIREPVVAPIQGYGDTNRTPPMRSIGPYGLMESKQLMNGGQHFAAGSSLAHQAGPLASLAANNNNESGTVNEYLKQVHFSDSDRDKLMASYLTCDGLLNDNDHCLERLSCEFSDPLNIEKANKLDRAVSSILLGHILINTYIPNNFKHRLKAASLYGYKHSGKCSRFVCNKLINKQHQQTQYNGQQSSSGSGDNTSHTNPIE